MHVRLGPQVTARIAILLLALAALIAVGGCGVRPENRSGSTPGADTRPASGDAPTAVRVARVEVGSAPRIVRATGSFEAEDTVTIGAKVAGRVVAVGPDAGDRVARGGMLVKVDDVDYRLAGDQRARALEEMLTKLGLTTLPEGEVDFEQLPEVERARLEAANAKSKYDRGLALHQRTPPLISEETLADLKVAWDVAVSAHRGARIAAQTDLAQARTRKADLDAAEQRIRDTLQFAPDKSETWLVAARLVSIGHYVVMGSPLYRLLDADPLRLRVRVPERRMAGITVGREVLVRLSEDAKPITSHVTRLLPEVDVRTRTHEVEICVANPDYALSVGAFAIAEILLGDDHDVPMVEADAVVLFAGIRKVFVPAGDRAGERLVLTGRRVGNKVEIVEGLKRGEPYIAAPPPSLTPGSLIRIVEGGSPK